MSASSQSNGRLPIGQQKVEITDLRSQIRWKKVGIIVLHIFLSNDEDSDSDD